MLYLLRRLLGRPPDHHDEALARMKKRDNEILAHADSAQDRAKDIQRLALIHRIDIQVQAKAGRVEHR